jgi:hypothetical protein
MPPTRRKWSAYVARASGIFPFVLLPTPTIISPARSSASNKLRCSTTSGVADPPQATTGASCRDPASGSSSTLTTSKGVLCTPASGAASLPKAAGVATLGVAEHRREGTLQGCARATEHGTPLRTSRGSRGKHGNMEHFGTPAFRRTLSEHRRNKEHGSERSERRRVGEGIGSPPAWISREGGKEPKAFRRRSGARSAEPLQHKALRNTEHSVTKHTATKHKTQNTSETRVPKQLRPQLADTLGHHLRPRWLMPPLRFQGRQSTKNCRQGLDVLPSPSGPSSRASWRGPPNAARMAFSARVSAHSIGH